jgi:hypothetical protein
MKRRRELFGMHRPCGPEPEGFGQSVMAITGSTVRYSSARQNHLSAVMAGLVPAIPIIGHCAILLEIAGTSPAMTPRVLLLLHPASTMGLPCVILPIFVVSVANVGT